MMLTFQRNKLLRLRAFSSDSEPMREANTSLQEFFTMCKEFSQVLSKASESYKEQPDTSIKVQESKLKGFKSVTRALARSSQTSSIVSHD